MPGAGGVFFSPAPAGLGELMMPGKFVGCILFLNRLGKSLAGGGLLFMAGLVTVDVILRRLFNAPIIFADEVSGYLLVLVTMLGISYTLQEDAHIQVLMVIDNIPRRRRFQLQVMMSALAIIYTLILLYLTGQLTWESYQLKAFSPTPSQLPLFLFQLVMPLGCLFFLFQLILGMVQSCQSLRSPSLHSSPEKE
jgi:TRAP-type C4-dicarboxylate transport system permease small subunit